MISVLKSVKLILYFVLLVIYIKPVTTGSEPTRRNISRKQDAFDFSLVGVSVYSRSSSD